jgi:hypothetical protein
MKNLHQIGTHENPVWGALSSTESGLFSLIPLFWGDSHKGIRADGVIVMATKGAPGE